MGLYGLSSASIKVLHGRRQTFWAVFANYLAIFANYLGQLN